MQIDLAEEVRAGVLAALAEIDEAVRTAVRAELNRTGGDPDRLVGVEEAAHRLGMTLAALRKAAARGTIPAKRVGRRLRFRVGDLP